VINPLWQRVSCASEGYIPVFARLPDDRALEEWKQLTEVRPGVEVCGGRG